MNKKKIILIAVSIAVVAGAGFWLFGSSKAQHKVTYETAVVTRGEISESITATGTIEPVTEVEVGTQVSGFIDKIYADYNSVVTKGQLIAEMDRVTLQSEVASQRAARRTSINSTTMYPKRSPTCRSGAGNRNPKAAATESHGSFFQRI